MRLNAMAALRAATIATTTSTRTRVRGQPPAREDEREQRERQREDAVGEADHLQRAAHGPHRRDAALRPGRRAPSVAVVIDVTRRPSG